MKRNMKYWKTTNSKTTTVQQKIGLKRNNNKTLDLNWLNIIYHRLILLLLRQLCIVKWCFLWELSALFNYFFFWWITDGQIRVEVWIFTPWSIKLWVTYFNKFQIDDCGKNGILTMLLFHHYIGQQKSASKFCSNLISLLSDFEQKQSNSRFIIYRSRKNESIGRSFHQRTTTSQPYPSWNHPIGRW